MERSGTLKVDFYSTSGKIWLIPLKGVIKCIVELEGTIPIKHKHDITRFHIFYKILYSTTLTVDIV